MHRSVILLGLRSLSETHHFRGQSPSARGASAPKLWINEALGRPSGIYLAFRPISAHQFTARNSGMSPWWRCALARQRTQLFAKNCLYFAHFALQHLSLVSAESVCKYDGSSNKARSVSCNIICNCSCALPGCRPCCFVGRCSPLLPQFFCTKAARLFAIWFSVLLFIIWSV